MAADHPEAGHGICERGREKAGIRAWRVFRSHRQMSTDRSTEFGEKRPGSRSERPVVSRGGAISPPLEEGLSLDVLLRRSSAATRRQDGESQHQQQGTGRFGHEDQIDVA